MNSQKEDQPTQKQLNEQILLLKQALESIYFSNQEINNSLAIILNSAEWLVENRVSQSKECDQYSRIIINAVERIKLIVANSEEIIEPLVQKSVDLSYDGPIRPSKPINILVVDDEPDFRLLLDKVLEKVGYTVMPAKDGEEALNLFKKNKFDLVITDVHMPKVDGIQLVIGIKEENPWIPVIVISGFEKESTIREKVKYDNVYFLRKPFMLIDLERAVEKILKLN